MYGEGQFVGESLHRVSRLTARQKRQIASLYGKAPKPMGTWEPLPSLTREETDLVLKEYEQQVKASESTPVNQTHPKKFGSWDAGLDRDFQDSTVETNSNRSKDDNVIKSSRNLSSPSLLQQWPRISAIDSRRPMTEYMPSMHPNSSSGQRHTQHSFQPIQSIQQLPSAPMHAEPHMLRSSWTVPHLSVYEQQHHMQMHPQTMRAPSSNVTCIQTHGAPPSNNWTAPHDVSSSLSSQSYATQSLHYTTTNTQNRAPLSSCTTALNRAPSPIRSSSPWHTDYLTPSTTNWTRPSDTVDYHPTQLLPLNSTTSCNNYSSRVDFQTPSSTSHSVSQLSSDLTSLSITLKSPSIEDVSNVDYSILVVGVTGSGKSSACNFFIGSDVFTTAGGAIAITAKSDAHVQNILGKRVLFIDTPGFGDEFASDEIRMAELGRAILFARDGVSAIMLCLDGSRRFDSSIANLLKEFEVLGTFWPYTFILYTHAADMGQTEEEQRSKITQWLSNPRCPDHMKWLFDKVCHRSMTVESKQFRHSTWYYQLKSQELMNMVEAISAQNRYQKYTNQFFQWAKRKYDQVKQQKLEHERELEKTQKNLEKYQSFVTLIEGDLQRKEQEHREFVTKQQQYISSLEMQLRSCREEERMRIQAQRTKAQEQLTRCTQDHHRLVDDYSVSREKTLARYDEDCKQCKEHEWQSRRVPMEVFLDELRYELYASNRERRELSDKLVLMDAKLQQMQKEKAQPQKKEETSMYDMAIGGAKRFGPIVAQQALTKICSLM